jgi:hypothetical protein
MSLPPKINTYHCICTSLLLASTHTLSSLPRRQGSSLDSAIILPLPSTPFPSSPSPDENDEDEEPDEMKPEGSTTLLNLLQDPKPIIVRREDGFEKRSLWRCGRCSVVVGYEILGDAAAGLVLGEGKGKGKGKEVIEGKIMYVLPGGCMSTDIMVSKKRIGEEDVDIRGGGRFAAFE